MYIAVITNEDSSNKNKQICLKRNSFECYSQTFEGYKLTFVYALINNWWHDMDLMWLVKQVLKLLYGSCSHYQ